MRPSILVYHHISSGRSGRAAADSVRAADFERQMAMLRERGFRTVSLEALLSLLRRSKKIDPKTVVVTFDDGYRSTFTRALPVLRRHSIPSTVFLATSHMGKEAPFGWLPFQEDKESLPMDWAQVEALRKNGVEIGSHTASHLFLPFLKGPEVERELVRSKEEIAERIGHLPHALALPYSYPIAHRQWPSFERILVAALEKSSYTSCSTLLRGRPAMRGQVMFLPRVSIMRNDTPASFYAKALGLYGYSGFLQFIYQRYCKNYGVGREGIVSALVPCCATREKD